MYIQSTRRAHPPFQYTNPKSPLVETSMEDSWSVPRWLSKPRSALSASNKLLKALEGFGGMENPAPAPLQKTVSALGAGFAVANVSAEICDGDYRGAVEDIASGAVSLTGGAKLLGLPKGGVQSLYAAGAVLNAGLAMEEFQKGELLDGSLRMGNVAGLLLAASDGLFRGPVGAALGPAGQAVLGVIGLTSIVRDLTEINGFNERPDSYA